VTAVAAGLAVAALALVAGLAVVIARLVRTVSSLQAVVDDLNREARPLLADLHGDARKASAGLDRVGDLVEAAESVTRRVDHASRLAYVTFSSPVVKVLAVGHGVSRVGRRLRGRADANGENGKNGKNGNSTRNGARKA
jgi:uncharacterized protein YoxC